MTTAPIQAPAPGSPQHASTPGLPVSGPGQSALAGSSAQPLTVDAARTGVLNQAMRAAASSQGGLAPLLADLQALTSPAGSAPAPLPPSVFAAVTQVLNLQTPLTLPLTGEDIRQALARSGLLLEAQLAAEVVQRSPGGGADDLKAALLTLRHDLQDWQESLANGPVAALPDPAEAPPVRASASIPPASPPPPPYPGGRTSAQPVAAAALAADAAPLLMVKKLLQETRAALSRQVLLQIASLRATGSRAEVDSSADAAEARWLFEAPFPTAQGSAVAQFEISRESPHRHGGPAEAVWRARFSLDVEPAGPVHAEVSLAAGRTRVTLWAERDAISERLTAEAGDLAEALAENGRPADIACRTGAPQAAAAPAGRFLDRAT